MEAFIMTITPKSGRIDSYGFWRSIEHVTRWINEELGEECARALPTTGEYERALQCALLFSPAKRIEFEALSSGIVQRWTELDQGTVISIKRLEEVVRSPQFGTADRTKDGMWVMDGEEMEDIFAAPKR